MDYEHTFKIELLNEFSNGVYARLLNYILKNGFDKKDENSFYSALLDQYVELLNLNLFELSNQELDDLEYYWENMNSYIKDITKEKRKEGEIHL